MFSKKISLTFVCIFVLFSIFIWIPRNGLSIRTVTIAFASNTIDQTFIEQRECWIEVEITPKDGKQETNDAILILLYDGFLSPIRQNILSWHFFREPTLRFRIEMSNETYRDSIAAELSNFLDSIDLVEGYYFSKHGVKIENLDQGY